MSEIKTQETQELIHVHMKEMRAIFQFMVSTLNGKNRHQHTAQLLCMNHQQKI